MVLWLGIPECNEIKGYFNLKDSLGSFQGPLPVTMRGSS